ncbi:hypothetical protein, partial [Vibrio alginolyticus]|uniref:hypothetical protein n=1 Tax=Vibrio alginolyticus TaxID=663 RepID=UPI0034E092C8
MPELQAETTTETDTQTRTEVILIAKHLCGVASDLALRALTSLSPQSFVRSVCLATCCHHACVYSDYVNTAWLTAQGIDR